jgi:hypothetical protein
MGLAGPVGGYASADFADADDVRPLAAVFDVGGHGSSTPYSLAINAMVRKQMEEIKAKSQAALAQPGQWKRKLREFLAQKNNDLLDFFELKVQTHSTLGPGEALLRRFGNPSVSPTHPSVRDLVMDGSGSAIPVLEDLNEAMSNLSTGNPTQDYAAQTRFLYEEYRLAGDHVLSAQAALKVKLDRLDRIQGKLHGLFEIDPNEKYEPLMIATEAYLKDVFEASAIEADYKKLIEAYRRFAILREVVSASRFVTSVEKEPLCCVCLNESVSLALVPCGHTFCNGCGMRQSGSCFMCRSSIKDKVKLFFG